MSDLFDRYYKVEGIGYFKWTKAIGDTHLCRSDDPGTLCGLPTLGSNYSDKKPDNKICKKCFNIAVKK